MPASKARDPDADRRDDTRFRRPAHVLYRSGDVEGKGILHDLSRGGARVEKATSPLEIGARVDLTLSVRGDLFPVEITAAVSRRTETGFAVEFDESDSVLRGLLEPMIADLAVRDDEEDDTEPTLS